jgi:glycosyltransferase 2 family protein
MTVTRPRLLAVLRLVATVVVLALVVRVLGAQDIGAQLRGTSWPWLALAVAALSGQIVLSALRWRLTAGALGLPVGRRRAVREYWLSVLGNTMLPGGVLGDLGRVARMRHDAGLGRAAETVVIERLAGQLALFAVAGLGAVAWFWPHPVAQAGAGGALVAGLVGAVTIRRAARGQGRVARLLRLLGRAWTGPAVWREQLGLTALILACNIGGFWAAARAVGLVLDPVGALFVIPAALAAMLVPLTVNGWGLREGAAAAVWPLAGASAAQSVAASVVFGVAALLAALPGVLAIRGR